MFDIYSANASASASAVPNGVTVTNQLTYDEFRDYSIHLELI